MLLSFKYYNFLMFLSAVFISGFAGACKKKEKETTGNSITAQPQLIRMPTSGLDLTGSSLFTLTADGATAQSFTPTSIKLSIIDIVLRTGPVDDWNGTGAGIYTCDGETNEDCLVEVADLKDFEDALNSEPVEISEGTYTKIGITMCKGNGEVDKQLIRVTGSTEMDGITYITDTDDGLVEGDVDDATPVDFRFGGCGVKIPLTKPITIESAEESAEGAENIDEGEKAPAVEADIAVRLLFDSYNFAMAGNMTNDATAELVANSAENLENTDWGKGSGCMGSKTGLFLCAQRAALLATDDPAPEIKRYAIALTDTESYDGKPAVAIPASTSYTALIKESSGTLIAAYGRRSVDFGAEFNKPTQGDQNFYWYKKLDSGAYELREGADGDTITYPKFKDKAHTGTRLDHSGADVTYSATLIE